MPLAEKLHPAGTVAMAKRLKVVSRPGSDMALSQHDNALLSPHIAGLTEEASERMAIASIENAMNTLNNTIDPAPIVNKEHLDD